MNRKTAWLIVFIIAFAAGFARAAEMLILFPLQTNPVIAQKASGFEVKLAGKTDEALKLNLLLDGNEYPLKIQSAGYENGITTVKVKAPGNIPEELYDLKAEAASGTGTRKHAVKIVSSFRKDYYFIHLTDAHISRTDYAYFRALADEINLINPEFVILTGDIVVNAEDLCRTLVNSKGSLPNCLGEPARAEIQNIIENEYEMFFKALDQLRVPVYVAPGNHDMAGPLNPVCAEIWDRHFIYRHFSFEYGNDYFAGLDNSQMFETAAMVYPGAKPGMLSDFDPEQLQWLESALAAHKSAAMKTLFFHCPLFGKKSGLHDIASRYQASLVLLGHHHVDMAWRQGRSDTLWLMTREARLGYRLIRVRDERLAGWGRKKGSPEYKKKESTLKVLPSGGRKAPDTYALDIGKLRAVFNGPNDGARESLTARITNGLDENFENALLKFSMKKGEYTVTGGVIEQTVAAGDTAVIYVSVSIPAGGESEIVVSRIQKP